MVPGYGGAQTAKKSYRFLIKINEKFNAFIKINEKSAAFFLPSA